MNNRFIGIALIATGAILIVGIIYFIFFYDFSGSSELGKVPEVGQRSVEIPTDTPDTPIVNDTPIVANDNPEVSKPSSGNTTPPGKLDLEDVASSFAERFGSYSNHSNHKNIEDLRYVMTESMRAWADDYLVEVRSKEHSDIYYGVTTKAIGTTVESYDDDTGNAVIVVEVLKRESTGTMSNSKTDEAQLELVFKKEDGVWKVDAASWL